MAQRNRASSFRRFAPSAVLAAYMLLSTGCWLRPTPFSPLPPLAPPPERLGQIMDRLRGRWPPVHTLQGQGELVLSGEGIRGKTWIQATILHASPDRLRFRASRPPLGTVFEILQAGQAVSIKLNRERKVFQGTAEELAGRPELIGGIEPLELARAVLIGESLAEAIDQEAGQDRDPAGLAFQNGCLVFSSIRPAPGGHGVERLEEFVIRQKDGLVEEARLSERDGQQWRRRLTIVYRHWEERGGRPYPQRFEILADHPATRLDVEVATIQFNPTLSPQVFIMDSKGDSILPLAELFQSAPQEGP